MKLLYSSVSVFLALFLGLAMLFPASAQAQVDAWQVVGTPGFSSETSSQLDIAVHQGTQAPYVLVQGSIYTFNQGQWEALPTLPEPYASHVSLAFDGTGNPYAAYNGGNPNTLTVARLNGSAWEVLATHTYLFNPTLAFDTAGTLYLSYQDSFTSKAGVKKWDGTNWEQVGPAEISPGMALYLAMALDSSGAPYLVYRDTATSNRATVQKFNGTAWEVVGSAGFSPGEVADVSIDFASDDTLYVAYQEDSLADEVTVQLFNGTNWEFVGDRALSPAKAGNPYLVVDESSGTPLVVYSDYNQAQKLTVQSFDGNQWNELGVPGFSDGAAFYPKIAVSSNGTVYAVYADATVSNLLTVQQFLPAVSTGGEIEAKVTIQEGDVTIGAPSLIQFPDTGVSDAEQTVDVTVTDHFFVKDLKAAAAGYFTTLSVSDMVDGSKTIAADNMEIRVENGTVEALEGTADANVTVPTATQTYTEFTSSSPVTLLQRSTDSNGLVGKYGVLPDFQLTIPAYQSLGSYTATMTYTLIEN